MPIRPEWGHPLICPDGRIIRVPSYVIAQLRKKGLLEYQRNRLKSSIYELINPQYDCMMDGLRHVLGSDLSGPEWIVCDCRYCREKKPYREPDMGFNVARETIRNRKE